MFHYLLLMLAAMFWVFRVIVAVTYNLGMEFGIEPLNFTAEIVLLFVTLFCFIFIAKRNLFGALLYLISYGAYFGVDLYKKVMPILDGEAGLMDYTSLMVSFIAIVLALLVFASVGITGSGKTSYQKTDWFFKNDDIQRVKDLRDDTNQYKF